MSTQLLNFGTDIGGRNAYAPGFPQIIVGMYMASGTAHPYTVPSTAKSYLVFFSYQAGVNFFVSVNSSPAVVPGSSTLSTINCLLNPSGLTVNAGDVISIITDAASGSPAVELALYVNTQ